MRLWKFIFRMCLGLLGSTMLMMFITLPRVPAVKKIFVHHIDDVQDIARGNRDLFTILKTFRTLPEVLRGKVYLSY